MICYVRLLRLTRYRVSELIGQAAGPVVNAVLAVVSVLPLEHPKRLPFVYNLTLFLASTASELSVTVIPGLLQACEALFLLLAHFDDLI